MNVYVKRNHEHFDVYIDGKFYCSADDETEAAIEIQNYYKNGSESVWELYTLQTTEQSFQLKQNA